jgi:hypothetical protein
MLRSTAGHVGHTRRNGTPQQRPSEECEKKTRVGIERTEKKETISSRGRAVWPWNGVVRAVSPDGDGSHLHPLTRCKSACIFPRTESDSPIHRSSTCVRADDVPCAILVWRWAPCPPSVYKKRSPVAVRLGCVACISPLPTRPRPGPCPPLARTPAHPISSSASLPPRPCMHPSLLAIQSDPSALLYFPIGAPWHPGLP